MINECYVTTVMTLQCCVNDTS